MDARPSWDEYFMQIARDVATRATCLRRHVGAVIVRDRRILSTGYNGSPPGMPHCLPYNERVKLGDGTTAPIGDIFRRFHKGIETEVISYDPDEDALVSSRVTNAWRKPPTVRPWVRLRTEGHRGTSRLLVSGEHRVYLANRDDYVPAEDIKIGDLLRHDSLQMTPWQEQILLGCSLGDGSVGRLAHWNAYLSYIHSRTQEEYARWKAASLSPFTSLREGKGKAFGKEWDRINVYCRIPSSFAPTLLKPRLERLQHLEPLGLAIWYQDDGTRKSSERPHLCTYMWNEEEAREACLTLTKRFGIHFIVDRHGKYFGIRPCSASKGDFFGTIAPYTHPSMRYKLPEKYRDEPLDADPEVPSSVSDFRVIAKETEEKRLAGYDIEVKDTHNFFMSNGVLVSNCTEVGCLIEDDRCIRTLHAEQNALIQAALHGVSTEGATMYGTCRPCHVCARMIVGAGIRRLVFAGPMPEGWALEVLDSARVEMVQMPDVAPASPNAEKLLVR
jgi:deoxycytidylate deaminase